MPSRLRLSLLALSILMAVGVGARAEKTDRQKPLVVESDGKQSAQVDLARKLTVVSGNVSISQGTMLIRADRVEVREPQDGLYNAVAFSWPARQATFQQKRDVADEFIEAQADRIEYDGASERIKLLGNAWLRMRRAGTVTDEASGSVITYDQRQDTVQFDGQGPAKPGVVPGKVRLVFTPRSASAPAAASAASSAGGAQ
ncbi:lipopolysaccharide transport periplasmic protein LptA [Ideonella sp. B7]|uniref:lipopolysaccharide transport periplasmic protein LptA n=1 Tax=Ideonella benzenivorans TaxID=2831643 RepID=UPI001CEDCC7A|nr:lipopolysaccharide transport periplasmic protein LptA [Ideonella benzenivorans]MCA6218504.1 lipopolysaccharide transport periplasmic protein LptA [Ideonella benzenivorans]